MQWTFERKLVAASFVCVLLTVVTLGAAMEKTRTQESEADFRQELPVEYRELDSFSTDPEKLRAIVKGSIYETAENMTVYGACYDGFGTLLPDATATFTAWYPNGTITTGPNATMQEITQGLSGTNPNGTGRFKIHVTMPSTKGTYLTEIRCVYEGEYATALGEWQNPVWVSRLSELTNISTGIGNITSTLNDFRNETRQNFSQVLTAIDNITIPPSNQEEFDVLNTQVAEIIEHVRSLDPNRWVIDPENPYFLLGSSFNDWYAVDMLGEENVHMVGDGFIAQWDGESYMTVVNDSNEWRAVTVVPSTIRYAWYAGTNGTAPIISVNGGNVTTPSLPGSSATSVSDIKIFPQPNNPSGIYYGYLLANDGRLYFSQNNGNDWNFTAQLNASDDGRVSQIVSNYADGAQLNGYLFMAGMNNSVVLHDGNVSERHTLPCQVKDVGLLYADLGYALCQGSGASYVYKYNGSDFALDYTIDSSTIEPVGIAPVTSDDIWVLTRDPSVTYHFDGVRWEFSQIGFSEVTSVVVTFNNVTGSVGMADVAVGPPDSGYAVGDDGVVLVFKRHYDARLDAIEELLGNITLDVNFSVDSLNGSLQELTDIVLDMNATVTQRFDDIDVELDALNASLTANLTAILDNTTYTNMYLESTVFPLLNSTYQNTLLILQRLGVIEQNVNETLEIVNQSQQDIEVIKNNTQPRIKSWVTP